MNKTKRIYIRISEEEFESLKKRAKAYKSMSAFLIDAGMKFDDRATIRRLDILDNWTAAYKKWEKDILYISNNINQMAHYCNIMKNRGLITEEIVNKQVDCISEWTEYMSKIIEFDRVLVKAMRNKG
jgi:hypothetical protein